MKYGKMKMVRLNSRARRAFPGSSRGFTLIEVLIAVALIGIVAIAILGALSTSSKTVSLADERTTAESLARRQIESIKSQGYNSTESVLNEPIYQKIGGIPAGYSIWSVNYAGAVVANIVGIPWDSQNNRPATKDAGLQKIALVIKYTDTANQVKVIYTFVNTNPYWAYNVPITLEAYKANR
jgi:prepilin-type N-terminal cleavage/methylation domain-containing protein